MTALTTTNNDLFSLSPRNLEEAMKYAELIAHSQLVPKQFQGKPGDVLVAVQMGAELGLKPTQALQNIAVVNGRPTIWGDAVIAIVKSSSLCEYVKEWFDDQTNTAYCETKRHGEDVTTRSFSFDDAKQAGLLGKAGPWTQYPKRMAQMRARGFALRDTYADLLSGIRVREEELDAAREKVINPAPSGSDAKKSGSLADRLKAANQAEKTPAHQDSNDIDLPAENPDLVADLSCKIDLCESLSSLESLRETISAHVDAGDITTSKNLLSAKYKERKLVL